MPSLPAAPRTRGEAQGRASLRTSREPARHPLDDGLPASGTVGERISLVLTTKFMATCYSSHRPLVHHWALLGPHAVSPPGPCLCLSLHVYPSQMPALPRAWDRMNLCDTSGVSLVELITAYSLKLLNWQSLPVCMLLQFSINCLACFLMLSITTYNHLDTRFGNVR